MQRPRKEGVPEQGARPFRSADAYRQLAEWQRYDQSHAAETITNEPLPVLYTTLSGLDQAGHARSEARPRFGSRV